MSEEMPSRKLEPSVDLIETEWDTGRNPGKEKMFEGPN